MPRAPRTSSLQRSLYRRSRTALCKPLPKVEPGHRPGDAVSCASPADEDALQIQESAPDLTCYKHAGI